MLHPQILFLTNCLFSISYRLPPFKEHPLCIRTPFTQRSALMSVKRLLQPAVAYTTYTATLSTFYRTRPVFVPFLVHFNLHLTFGLAKPLMFASLLLDRISYYAPRRIRHRLGLGLLRCWSMGLWPKGSVPPLIVTDFHVFLALACTNLSLVLRRFRFANLS